MSYIEALQKLLDAYRMGALHFDPVAGIASRATPMTESGLATLVDADAFASSGMSVLLEPCAQVGYINVRTEVAPFRYGGVSVAELAEARDIVKSYRNV